MVNPSSNVFGFQRNERSMAFFDGPNFTSTCKMLGFSADFRELRDYMEHTGDIRRFHYFTPVDYEKQEAPEHALFDWLDYNGFQVHKKALRRVQDPTTGAQRVKGSVAVEIASEMFEAVGHVDHIVLFSGDGDLQRAVRVVQNKGVRVTIASTIALNPPVISDSLRRAADRFIEVDHLAKLIARDPPTGRSIPPTMLRSSRTAA